MYDVLKNFKTKRTGHLVLLLKHSYVHTRNAHQVSLLPLYVKWKFAQYMN